MKPTAKIARGWARAVRPDTSLASIKVGCHGKESVADFNSPLSDGGEPLEARSESQADRDIRNGDVKGFANIDDLLADLDD